MEHSSGETRHGAKLRLYSLAAEISRTAYSRPFGVTFSEVRNRCSLIEVTVDGQVLCLLQPTNSELHYEVGTAVRN